MLIFLWPLWPIVIPIAIGGIILAALGGVTVSAGPPAASAIASVPACSTILIIFLHL